MPHLTGRHDNFSRKPTQPVVFYPYVPYSGQETTTMPGIETKIPKTHRVKVRKEVKSSHFRIRLKLKFQVIVGGEQYVGKSSLVNVLVGGAAEFSRTYKMVSGVMEYWSHGSLRKRRGSDSMAGKRRRKTKKVPCRMRR